MPKVSIWRTLLCFIIFRSSKLAKFELHDFHFSKDQNLLLYHIISKVHREFLEASKSALARESEYSTRFFPEVVAELRRRGLEDLVFALPKIHRSANVSSEHFSNAGPEGTKQPPPSRPDMTWTNYSVAYNQRFDTE